MRKSVLLSMMALILASCNPDLKGKTYYQFCVSSQGIARETELHFLSDEMVEVKLSLYAAESGRINYRDNPVLLSFESPKVYRYWVNDDQIDIPDYKLKITIDKHADIFGYSHAQLLFDSGGVVYNSSILDHLKDNVAVRRIRSAVPDEKGVRYFLDIISNDKKNKARELFEKELPIEQEEVKQKEDVSEEKQREIISKPNPYAEFSEGGTVIVQVLVDKEGHIIEKKIKSSTNENLNALALKGADETQFSKGEEKTYDLSFVFKEK